MSADAIVSYALSLEGLSYGDTRERYLAELYPYDTPFHANQMGASQESCGLTCEAILRRSEVDGTCSLRGQRTDHLRVPYASRVGSTVAYQEQLAREHGLWRTATLQHRPAPADMVTVGGINAGGPTHVLTVTGVDGDVLETIEGGQPDPSNKGRCTAIRRKLREVYARHGALWLRDAGTAQVGRRVQGWLHAGELPVLAAR